MLQRICSLLRMTPPIILNRGLLFHTASSVPVDDTDGFQTGCIFQHTGATGTSRVVYLNEGTVTACAFRAIEAGDFGEFASLESGSGIPLSSSDTANLAVFGDDNGLSIASSVYNLRTRLLLTVDQDGASLRALMAQLKLADGVDVSTGVYTASQGYLELAGNTSAETGATLSCFDASLEIASAKVLTVDSGGVVAGIRVETTGAGTITNNGTCAAILIANPTGAPDWPVGIFIAGPDVLMGIQCGEQDAAVAITSAYPFGVEVQTISSTNIVAGDTGSAAAIYARYEIGVDQTTNTAHIGIFGKLRVKEALYTGNHAGLMGWVEVSGTTIIGGAATTQTSAGSFSVIAEVGLDLTTGFLNGILIDSSIATGATTTGVTAAARVKVSASCDAWDTGLVLEDSSIVTGIDIGTCTTGVNVTGACTQAYKAEYSFTGSLGGWCHGMKVEVTRAANVQPATSGWMGAQFVLNAGSSGYDAIDKPAYALQAVFKGSDTDPEGVSGDVHVARFETQSNGKVSDICYITANSGSTIVGSLLYLATHVAPGKAMVELNVQSSQTVAQGLSFMAGSGSTLTSLLYASGSGTFTNFLEVAASGDGGVTVTSITGLGANASGFLKVKVGTTTYYVPIYGASELAGE